MPPESSAGFFDHHRSGRPSLREARQHQVLQFRLLHPAMLPQRKGDVLAHGHAVEQGGILKYIPEANSLDSQFFVAEFGPTSFPSKSTFPEVGRIRPMIVFISTVFPPAALPDDGRV